MKNLNNMIELLRGNPDHELFEGASEAQVGQMEASLGVNLPLSFRDFLMETDGALLYERSNEIYGTKDVEDLRTSLLTARQHLREFRSLPDNLLPFHNGACTHCFDLANRLDGEYGIVELTPDGRMLPDDSSSFTKWLEKFIAARED